MDITVGTLVFSKAGRDKGEMFLTLSVENGYAYIADGDLRRVEKPKKKKLIHLHRKKNKVELGEITNSAVRKIVAQYKPV